MCPVLLQLTAGDSNDDYRSEAIAVSVYQNPLFARAELLEAWLALTSVKCHHLETY